MLIITNKVKGVFYFPGQTEDGKWTIFQMTKRYHWKKVWTGTRNTTFDTYKECEIWMNILDSGSVFGRKANRSIWSGEDERAKYVLGISDDEGKNIK